MLKEKAIEALVTQLRESNSQDVWQKCAGCLMVLTANQEAEKEKAGVEGAIPELARIVHRSQYNKPTLKAALGALAVLTSDKKNAAKLRGEGLNDLLEQFAKEKDERIQQFVNSLMDRLDPSGGDQ